MGDVTRILLEPGGRLPSPGSIRVAAYCRVSTELDSQRTSLTAQMEGLQAQIRAHPGWTLAGVYADEGLSATQTRHRKQFLQMLRDAYGGKLDYILAKSISRFARNTVECISIIRQLQAKGVQVYFEKEHLDTGSVFSEMLLTVLAAFAQEERRSISENVKWGIRKRFEQGQGRWVPLYGYRCGSDGSWLPQPEQAQVVAQVFAWYEFGASCGQIAEQLNSSRRPSPRGGRWSKGSVRQMLLNEKYVGDLRLQKYISVDHLTHRSCEC